MAEVDGTKHFEEDAERVLREDEEVQKAERALELARRRAAKGGDVIDADTGEMVTVDEVIPMQDDDGNMVDTHTGKAIDQDDAGNWFIVPPWEHETLDFDGWEVEFRTPKTAAAMFLSKMAMKREKNQEKVAALLRFLNHVLSPRSREELEERVYSWETPFDTEDIIELVQRINEAGSARPTQQTSRSAASR